MAGTKEGFGIAAVSCVPISIAAIDAIIPGSRPEIAKSNITALYLGADCKDVTLLVMPVRNNGTKVGAVVLICV